MRLIDADALIEDIKSFWDWDSIDGITATTVLKQTMTDISNAPAIDAEPVRHGKWLHPEEEDEDYHTVSCSCSVCGWKFNLYEDDIDGAPYCAVCGAKMEPVSPLYQTDEEEP